jgi:hypothetical protein
MSIILDGNNATTGGVINAGTAQNSTSGTAITFTGIPSTAKRITVMFNNMQTSGSSQIQLQIGSGSVTSSGYTSGASLGSSAYSLTSGFLIVCSTASAHSTNGHSVLTLVGSNTWVESSVIHQAGNYVQLSAGNVSLSGALDRVVVTTVNGTDTFTAGSINIFWE